MSYLKNRALNLVHFITMDEAMEAVHDVNAPEPICVLDNQIYPKNQRRLEKIYQHIQPEFSPNAFKVLELIVDVTWRFGRDTMYLSTGNIANGCKCRPWIWTHGGTGLSLAEVRNSLDFLLAENFIKREDFEKDEDLVYEPETYIYSVYWPSIEAKISQITGDPDQ